MRAHLRSGDEEFELAETSANGGNKGLASKYFTRGLLEYGQASRIARELNDPDALRYIEERKKAVLGRMEAKLQSSNRGASLLWRINSISSAHVTRPVHATAVILLSISIICMILSYSRLTGSVIGDQGASGLGIIAIAAGIIGLIALLKKKK